MSARSDSPAYRARRRIPLRGVAAPRHGFGSACLATAGHPLRTLRLAVALVVCLAWVPSALAQEPDLGTEEQRAHGKEVYDKWCGQCHGDAGDGQGIATPYLLPEPRDFTSAKYKFRSTPFGFLPTEADLEHSIRDGLAGTGMPGFPELSDDEVTDVIQYLKTFSSDWQDPGAYSEPMDLPDPPPFSAERAAEGEKVYFEIGCARCHGDEGRGDGSSAPTLRDDWGDFIRVADLTMPWTFRGGATRADIFRTLTTGIYGTPMASFGDALTVEQRWALVDWMVERGGGEGAAAPFRRLVRAHPVDGDIELPADPAAVREPFADAEAALFPIVGQVMEPGRAFHPAARAVEVKAIVNRDEIAFLVSWHDMKADVAGVNSPDAAVPPVGMQEAVSEVMPGSEGAGSAAVGEELGGSADTASSGGDDFWGSAAAPAEEAEDDGDAAEDGGGGGDFWGTGGDAGSGAGSGENQEAADPFASDTAAAPSVPESDWSDAVALQFPVQLRPGVAKPYFLFGDPSYPVELWHVDLAKPDAPGLWEGRGSQNLTPVERTAPQVVAHYEAGRWSVAFKRPRAAQAGPSFADEDVFVPLAATVWDGFHQERGNKRGLTQWFHVHVPPLEAPSPVGSMLRAGFGVLGLELLIVFLARRRFRHDETALADPADGPEST